MDFPKPGPYKIVEIDSVPSAPVKQEIKIKPAFARKPHLTQRPFVNPAIVSLRDGMQRSVKIKKK